MNLLALETATDACSCALLCQGKEIVAIEEIAPRRHAERILPMIEQVLAQGGIEKHALDAIAVGRGPGSFTGVRIALGIAQGLGFALDIPVLPISTLACLAQSVAQGQARYVAVALDARMNEVYWGCFEVMKNGLVMALGDEQVIAPHQIVLSVTEPEQWCALGEGWTVYGDVLHQCTGILPSNKIVYPFARHLLPLATQMWLTGNTLKAEQALPVYVRNQVTQRQ